jgi:glycosyltransferase involved in cell wall biosynthesis
MTPRTVLVDLRCCQFDGDRGIPAYAQSLTLELVAGENRLRWLLLHDPRWPLPARSRELAARGEWCTAADLDAPRAPRIDVLLTGCFFLPHGGCDGDYLYPDWLRRQQPRRLGIVYDLVPLLFPDRYLARDRARRQYHDALRVLRGSDHLFAISRATRRDTIRHAAVDPLRIDCIYGDIDHAKRALMAEPSTATAHVPARHGLTGRYCVCVGGGDWRKNLDVAVQAFARFRRDHPGHQLAIVCKLPPARIAELRRQAAAAGLPAEAVVCTGYVPDEELVALVRHAELLVYPSLYEGLGLPVLEAYGCGTPVVGSDSSSVAELVLPALACDPEDPTAIAATMARLVTSPGLREESLAFGRRLLADELGWGRAAERVLDRIRSQRRGESPPATAAPRAKPRLAVIAALPPARTGIAPYSLRYLQGDAWETCFYEAGDAPRLAVPAGVRAGNRVLPAEVFPAAALRGRHDTAIFVLGNSPHHVAVLDALMRSRGTLPRRLAYLHEAALDSLFRAWLGPDVARLPSPSPSPSPAPAAAAWIGRSLAAKPALASCLRLLIERGELDGLIVNSTACRDLVLHALGDQARGLTIDVVHNPIADLPDHLRDPARGGPTRAEDELRIGSFGLAGDTKRLDVVARAVTILRRRRPARLLVAGWEARSYCRRAGLAALAGVEVLDAPDDDTLISAMRSVDLAVQLRSPTFGESSGVVSQLLAIGTPLVVNDEGSFAELPPDVATLVAADCSPADLAAAIESAAGRRIAADRLTAIRTAWSAEAFAARLAEIVAAGPQHRERGSPSRQEACVA